MIEAWRPHSSLDHLTPVAYSDYPDMANLSHATVFGRWSTYVWQKALATVPPHHARLSSFFAMNLRTPPKTVLDVIPLVRWTREGTVGDALQTSTRHNAGLRVWLARPWFSSGAGEMLGLFVTRAR